MKSDRIIIDGNTFDVLIAISEDEQIRGLMYRKAPVPNMAFPFPQAKVTKFWMLNTLAPLDIVFCCAGRVIGSYFGAPLSKKLVGPDSPTDLVVEFPAGHVDKYKIAEGSDVRLAYSIETLAKWYRNNSFLKTGT
jgi:hypothetical protein